VALDVALDACSPVSGMDQTEEEKKERAKGAEKGRAV
jgi:hypothetical protein